MEHTPRLFQCELCHAQVMICSGCDRGQIYCGRVCALISRKKSMKMAGARYQATFAGKLHHAARQSAYRRRLREMVTHQGSPFLSQNASMATIKNKAERTERRQRKSAITCCFCQKPVSDWIRNDFLRRRGHQKLTRLRSSPQGP